MSKKYLLRKVLVLSLVLTMLMLMNAFASTNTTSSGNTTVQIYAGEFYGNPLYLYANIDYNADYGWEEGYYSWVN